MTEEMNEKGSPRANETSPENDPHRQHEDHSAIDSAAANDPQAARRQRREEIKAIAEVLYGTGGGDMHDCQQEAARIVAEHEAQERGEKFPDIGATPDMAIQEVGNSFSLSLGLLHALVGGEITGDGQILAPGPGHSAHDRSMCVTPSSIVSDGFCVHSFSPRTTDAECKAYINFLFREWMKLHLASDDDVSIPIIEPAIEAKSEEDRVMSARQIWNRASPALGQSAYDYLASRGLQLPDEISRRVASFEARGRWYHANGKRKDRNNRPFDDSELLIWACRDVHDDTGRAVQLVRMPHIGMGPVRKVRGLVKNAAIKITPHDDVMGAGELAIAEGFESALAAMMLGYRNVWAAVSSSNVANFPVLDGVRKLTILAENCRANEKARLECAMRWLAAGREVTIATPDHGKDFNDELIARFAKAGE